jgi:hypothetical protein
MAAAFLYFVTVHGFSAILPVAEAQWDRGEL